MSNKRFKITASIDWHSTPVEIDDDFVVEAETAEEAEGKALDLLSRQISEARDSGPDGHEVYLDAEPVEEVEKRDALLKIPYAEREAINAKERLDRERAAFEEWYANEFTNGNRGETLFLSGVRSADPEGYAETYVNIAWRTWRAKAGV